MRTESEMQALLETYRAKVGDIEYIGFTSLYLMLLLAETASPETIVNRLIELINTPEQ
jgi:hypothetical protein